MYNRISKRQIVFIIQILGFLVFSLAITLLFCFQSKKKEKVPKKIWTYWHDPNNISPTVKMCLKSWNRQNPDYKIIMIHKQNYPEFVDIDPEIANHPSMNDSNARFSDLIRLCVLEKQGGYWIDSSILLKIPLSEIFTKNVEFSAFYRNDFTTKKEFPVIESWMFCCKKKSKFTSLWKKEFLQITEFENVDKYLDSRQEMGVDFQELAGPHYLAIHVAAQKVLQIDKYPLERLDLQMAEEGPFLYLSETNWNTKDAVEKACNQDNYKVLKLRNPERGFLDQYLNSHLSDEKCKWII